MGPLIQFRDGFALWLPLLFGVMLFVMVWLMWRMLKLMPQVKPAEVDTKSKSAVTWADVAEAPPAGREREKPVMKLAAAGLTPISPVMTDVGTLDTPALASST